MVHCSEYLHQVSSLLHGVKKNLEILYSVVLSGLVGIFFYDIIKPTDMKSGQSDDAKRSLRLGVSGAAKQGDSMGFSTCQ